MKRILLVFALAVVAGCGSDTEPAEDDGAARAADSAFPAQVEHKFGTTTVPSKPERIVVVGLTEQDTVLALGYKPIATTEWYGEQPHAVWPWAREALGDAKPTVLNAADGLQFERIASLRPDLIIGVNAGLKRGDYEKLSRLAPTVPSGKGSTDYFSAWEEQVELVAAALGKPEEGRQLVQSIKDDYAEAAAAHPEFEGKTATFSQNGFYDGLLYVYPDGLNTEFLTMLGFTINPKLTPLMEREGEQVDRLSRAPGRDRRRRDRVRHRAAVGRRRPEEGPDVRQPRGRRGEPGGLHGRHAGRGDLLHQPAQPAVRARAPGATARGGGRGRGAAAGARHLALT